LGESEESTPLARKWAIPSAIIAVAVVAVSLYFGTAYVLLSADSIRGVLSVCMLMIGCAMVTEFTMRGRHRVVVGFVGGLCLFVLFGFYVLSYNPKYTTLSYWLGVGTTVVFFLVFALYALRESKPVVSEEGVTRLPELDRAFFRDRLFGELVAILDQLRSPIVIVSVVSYAIWRDKADYEKIQLLGADDYSKLDAFYRKVDERNKLYAGSPISEFLDRHDDKSRRDIIDAVKRLFDEVAWLRVRRDEVNWPTE
jgi:hypothetical protein